MLSRSSRAERCSDVFVEGAVQGAFTGTVFGSLLALHVRRLHPEPNAARQIARSLSHSVFLFTALMSVYQGVTCCCAKARARDDPLNAAIGGALAGVCASLPQRSVKLGVQNALGMAIIGALMDRVSNSRVHSDFH